MACNSRSSLILRLSKGGLVAHVTDSGNREDIWRAISVDNNENETDTMKDETETINGKTELYNELTVLQPMAVSLEHELQPIATRVDAEMAVHRNVVHDSDEIEIVRRQNSPSNSEPEATDVFTIEGLQSTSNSERHARENIDLNIGHPDIDPYATDDDVAADPDYSPRNDISKSPLPLRLCDVMDGDRDDKQMKKPKKRIADPAKWKANIAKRRKYAGEEYLTRKNKKVPKKEMGSGCTCKQNCMSKFDEIKRGTIFSDYWALGSLQRQRDFILQNMEPINPKYRYVRERDDGDDGQTDNKKRKARKRNDAFFLTDREKETKVRVCKTFFKSTLGISDRQIRTVMSKRVKSLSGMTLEPEKRGKHGNFPLKIDEARKDKARKFIESIPRIESHYTRKNTQREFIEGGKTVAQLHRDYMDKIMHKEHPNETPLTYEQFNSIFKHEFNISFFLPKKDQCEQCIKFENSSADEKELEQESYQQHILEKDAARLEMEDDVKKNESSTHVATFDLQAVIPCPQGDASGFYYVSKLSVFNFTIVNMRDASVKCYVCHEGEGHRGVNEIGSCILQYLKELNETGTENVIFYSDNCGGQAKNYAMFNLFNYAIEIFQNIKTITHKFLIRGHTQNKGDMAHSLIEKKLKLRRKGGPIYSPDGIYQILRSVTCQKKPLQVIEMEHNDFLDIKSIDPTFSPKTIRISECRVVQVSSWHQIRYSWLQPFEDVPKLKRKRKGKLMKPLPVYKEKPKISEDKKKGLLSLFKKKIIPNYYFDFYNSL